MVRSRKKTMRRNRLNTFQKKTRHRLRTKRKRNRRHRGGAEIPEYVTDTRNALKGNVEKGLEGYKKKYVPKEKGWWGRIKEGKSKASPTRLAGWIKSKSPRRHAGRKHKDKKSNLAGWRLYTEKPTKANYSPVKKAYHRRRRLEMELKKAKKEADQSEYQSFITRDSDQ